jgi:hypothetical protein
MGGGALRGWVSCDNDEAGDVEETGVDEAGRVEVTGGVDAFPPHPADNKKRRAKTGQTLRR